MIRPTRLSLARISVIRGEGPDEGVPFIDEYIATNEAISDHLTKFSGIKRRMFLPSSFLDIIQYHLPHNRSTVTAGDLDISKSDKPLVSLKVEIIIGDIRPPNLLFALFFKFAYKKLRFLVDAGCVFIGHGLKKDFRTISKELCSLML